MKCIHIDGKFFSSNNQRIRLHGVSYGPFKPNENGEQFPSSELVKKDFALMREAGINTIRTYIVPPKWFLDIANEEEILVFIDVPWSKHLCFFDNNRAQKEARTAVKQAAERCKKHPCVSALSIGNEIPPDIIRWHGVQRVERFIKELMDVVKNVNPDVLVTYANYPPTEYLDLSFLDFLTFNVYLHDLETFRRYLIRLQNISGNKPLVLGEIGMDTIRQGEKQQAQFLAGHIREALLLGLAGTIVFSWTDDWHTGGYQIQDWAFGITKANRFPKPAYHALKTIYGCSPAKLLEKTPKTSVVVCSYNGSKTLDECLKSLSSLDYPNYEIILVDDGSKDNTKEIVKKFPGIQVIHQGNKGLSVARNVGLQKSSGSIIAYTDSDCFADQDWLTHLVYQLEQNTAAAIGGPNLTPEDGWVAACIDSSPGQPTHVLENDQMAEHIPGCNMAFRRDALEAVNGFDPQFRQAGDDVDICWRLQQAGFWITFAPSAFVWHHRRQSPKTYFRQQAGYGKAEALLRFKHPDKYNSRGEGRWRGVVYGTFLKGLRLGKSVIYQGIFGTGLFQTLYQSGYAHWAMLPSTLEWHVVAGLIAPLSFLWPSACIVSASMIALSIIVAVLQASQAPLDSKHKGFKSRLLIAALCYVQPLVRSWKRYLTRILSSRSNGGHLSLKDSSFRGFPLKGEKTIDYWTEEWKERTDLLDHAISHLKEQKFKIAVDSGWSKWDLEINCHPWTSIQVFTVQEDHGGGKRLIRIRFKQRLTKLTKAVAPLGVIASGLGIGFLGLYAIAGMAILTILLGGAWWRGTYLASHVVKVFDKMAEDLNLIPCK